MKKRKTLVENQLSVVVYSDEKVKISKDGNRWCFEVGKEITMDLAEGVSLLLRTIDFNHPIWKLEIQSVDIETIVPEKSLFWLSGGYTEWRTLEHYRKPWFECYLEFQEEFGFIIINSVKKSKKLEDLREYFLKYLNLPVLYDFAISRNLVK